MKKLTLLAVILGAFSAAHADQYVSAKLGASVVKASDLSVDSADFDLDQPAVIRAFNASNSENDTVFNGSIAYGYAFESLPVRTELEYTFRSKAKLDGIALPNSITTNADMRTQNLMANVYYDFRNSSSFTPYVSAGVGASFNKLNVSERDSSAVSGNASDKKTDFAWSLGLGVNYEINKNLDLDLAYRYMDLGKVDTTVAYAWAGQYTGGTLFNGATVSDYEAKLKTHDFTVGLRYKF